VQSVEVHHGHQFLLLKECCQFVSKRSFRLNRRTFSLPDFISLKLLPLRHLLRQERDASHTHTKIQQLVQWRPCGTEFFSYLSAIRGNGQNYPHGHFEPTTHNKHNKNVYRWLTLSQKQTDQILCSGREYYNPLITKEVNRRHPPNVNIGKSPTTIFYAKHSYSK
jgi:hypothetical protein